MARRVVFPAKNEVRVEEFTPPDVRGGQLRVRSLVSLISSGTELTVLAGDFAPGTHWAGYATYPFYPGYSSIGVVDETGPDVHDFRPGDRVAFRLAHASESVVDAVRCTQVPVSVQSEDAVWFALAKIALMGAQVAHYRLGDTVVVVGAGPVGQMSLRWAVAAGARRVVAVDISERRLEFAKAGGATHVVHGTIEGARDAVLESCGGARPRVLVDTTGRADALADILPIAADHGSVVLVGDTGHPQRQHLTSDVIVRGVSVHGAHDSFNAKSSEWDHDRSLHELFFHLVATARFDTSGLITHRYPPSWCTEAYAVLREKSSSMGVLFDWTDVEEDRRS